MTPKNDEVYLQHILDAIAKIEQYTTGVSYQVFSESSLVQDGTVHELEIIGEASRNLSEEFRNRHDEVPWHQIIGMRNRIVHVYFDLDLPAVWDAVKLDVPDLKAKIIQMLRG